VLASAASFPAVPGKYQAAHSFSNDTNKNNPKLRNQTMYVVPARAYCNSFFIVRAKFIQQHYNKTKTDKNYQEKKIKTILRSSPWSSSIVFEYERIIS